MADEAAAGGLGRLPVLTKDDVLARQQEEPPFGGMLAAGAPVRRVFRVPPADLRAGARPAGPVALGAGADGRRHRPG